jgi:hypothetical protein
VGERRTNPGAGGQFCLVTPAAEGEAKSAVVFEQKTLSGVKLIERNLFSVMFQGTDLTVVIRCLLFGLGIEPATNYLIRKQYLYFNLY